jgi:hypothetical protein
VTASPLKSELTGDRAERPEYAPCGALRGRRVSKQPDCPLIPVLATSGCAGHLRRTPRGFVAYDCNDKPIGIFTNTDDGAAASLALNNHEDRE